MGFRTVLVFYSPSGRPTPTLVKEFAEESGLAINEIHDAEEVMALVNRTFPAGVFPNGVLGSPARWERQIRMSGYATYSGFTDHSLRLGMGHEDLNMYKVRTLKNFLLNAAGAPTPDLAFNGGAQVDYSTRQPHQPVLSTSSAHD